MSSVKAKSGKNHGAGKFDVAQDPVRHRQEPIRNGVDQVGKCLLVAALCTRHEIGVHIPSNVSRRRFRPTRQLVWVRTSRFFSMASGSESMSAVTADVMKAGRVARLRGCGRCQGTSNVADSTRACSSSTSSSGVSGPYTALRITIDPSTSKIHSSSTSPGPWAFRATAPSTLAP